jgi:hypothetical protein
MSKRQSQVDAGLQQIAEWHHWFVNAHTQRLDELNLPADQYEREYAFVLLAATAVTERRRSDLLARMRHQ